MSILLVSHQLDFSGAPVALLALAKALTRLKRSVKLISLKPDEGIGANFQELGVTILDQANLSSFHAVVFNTVLTSRFIPTGNTNAKTIAWVHESPYLGGFGWSNQVSAQRLQLAQEVWFPSFACKSAWAQFLSLNSNVFVQPSPVFSQRERALGRKTRTPVKICVIDPRASYTGIERIETYLRNVQVPLEVNFIGANPPPQDSRLPPQVQVYYHGRVAHSEAMRILEDSDVYLSATCIATQNRGLCEAMMLGKFVFVSHIAAHIELIEKSKYRRYKTFFPLDQIDLEITTEEISAVNTKSPNSQMDLSFLTEEFFQKFVAERLT